MLLTDARKLSSPTQQIQHVQGEFHPVRVHSCCANAVLQEKHVVSAALARPFAAFELALQLQWLLLPSLEDPTRKPSARVRVRHDLRTLSPLYLCFNDNGSPAARMLLEQFDTLFVYDDCHVHELSVYWLPPLQWWSLHRP
jgi:hypothetical protein